MAEKVITYKIEVEVDGVKQSVEKVANSFDNLAEAQSKYQAELNKSEIGSKAYGTIKKKLDEVTDAQEKAKLATQSFGDSMSAIPGPMGKVSQGVQGLGKMLKVLAANPIILAITILVGLVVGLFKAFTSTKEGAEKLDRVMAGVSAAMNVLRDKVLQLFSSWENFTKIFTLDFWKDTAREINNEAQAAANLTGELQKLDDAQRGLNERRAKQNKELAESKGKITDESLSYKERQVILEDVIKKEKKLLEEEIALEKKRLDAMVALADQSDSSAAELEKISQQRIKLYNLEEQSANKTKEAETSLQGLRKAGEAEAKARYERAKKAKEDLFNFEQALDLELIFDERDRELEAIDRQRTDRIKQAKELTKDKKKLNELLLKIESDFQNDTFNTFKKYKDLKNAEEDAATKKIIADKATARTEAISEIDTKLALGALENNLTLQQLTDYEADKRDILLTNDQLTADERLLIEAQYVDKVKKLGDAVTANKKIETDKESAARTKKEQDTLNMLGTISDAAGKETAIGKAAAAAQAGYNTWLGASQAAADETLPSVLKPFYIAALIALGAKNVQNILSTPTNIPKYATGGIVSGSGDGTSDSITAMVSNGESVINANSTRMFGPLLSTINQAGGGTPFNTDALSGSNGGDSTNSMPVIKTYVVSSDMTSQQQFDRDTKSRSLI